MKKTPLTKRKLILEFKRAPGDVLMMSGLVRDLKLTYGDKYQIDVRTQFPAIWRHNPHLTKLSRHDRDVQVINLGGNRDDAADRVGIRMSKAGAEGSKRVHYATVFHHVFEQRTGVHVPVLRPHGDIHLSDKEKAKPCIGGRYWIIVPGGKVDMTNKWWYFHRYQEVVDHLRAHGLSFVQEGSTKDLHVHPPLTGVLNVVGQTSVRDLILNIHHSEGVICGCTFQMHIAGALHKPCVVILGGREEPWYEAYCDDYNAFGPQASPTPVPHRVLHTMGLLGCCKTRGCWRRRTVPLRDGRDDYDKETCLKVHNEPNKQTLPLCMHMIETDHVCEAVMSYYEDRTLEPIGKPTGKYTVTSSDLVTPPGAPPAFPPLPSFVHETEHQQTGNARKPKAKTTSPPTPNKAPKSPFSDGSLNILDHPLIGGQVTIFALLHGQEHNLHRRCLTSICETVPPSRMDLRVFGNQVNLDTVNFLNTLPVNIKNLDYKNRRKYDAMRLAFNDSLHAIETDWLIWFDDVAYVRHGKWLSVLAETIINQRPADKVALYGTKMRHQLGAVRKDPRKWFTNGSWWQGRDFRNKLGADSPNGDQIHYVSPNFFALNVEAMRNCGIPDNRITQSGGGVVIGEQIHQGGYKIKEFSRDGKFVASEQPNIKRGYSEKYPWT